VKKALILAALIGSLGAKPAFAKLDVGDAAPQLHIKDWVQGEPVDLSKVDKKAVIVVEFWATWCGPCLRGIPHISDMQDYFKDKNVTFIGVTDEDKALITRFLEGGWDKKMRYTVACDDKGKTNRAWMKAAQQQGIPCAFVVNDGKVKWIGHPMDDAFGDTIAKLVDDLPNWKKAEKGLKAEAEQRAAKERAEAEKKNVVLAKIRNAVNNEEWQKAFDAMGELLELNPDDFAAEFGRYHLLQVKMDKKKDAAKYGRDLVEKTEDVRQLDTFAFQLLKNEDFAEARDLELSLLAIKKAMKLSDEKDPSVLDTYAWVLAEQGDFKRALELGEKAVELAEGRMKVELQKSLEEMKKQKQAAEA